VKVLLVIDSLSFGGAENVLVTLASQAAHVGLTLKVLALAPSTDGRGEWLPRLRRAGLEVRFLGVERLLEPTAAPRLAAAISASGCDVVHAHLETATTLAPPAARLARRPVLCTLHHVPVPLSGREAVRERLAVTVGGWADGLLFVSQASRDAFAQAYPRSVRPSRWQVLHNGVDLERFRPPPAAAPRRFPVGLGIPTGAPVVALVGHMRPGKGQDVAIDAWPAVLRTAPQARLLLVGSGPHQEGLRRQAHALGVNGRVVFAGARDDVDALIRNSTLVVLPTRMEALPTVLLEAAASGVAAVATAVGGVPEVVIDGETGWLVPAPRPDLFADALGQALVDPAEIRRRGAAARVRAERHFGAQAWAVALRRRYETATGAARVAHG